MVWLAICPVKGRTLVWTNSLASFEYVLFYFVCSLKKGETDGNGHNKNTHKNTDMHTVGAYVS